MKKIAAILLCFELMGFLSSCGTGTGAVPSMPEEPPAVFMRITLTAGDTTLQGVLFDNETARAFSDLLPLDAVLWDPAPGFARAFNLENILPVTAERTRAYELGGLAYWNSGPSIAIFYNDDRDKVELCLSAGHRTTQNIRAKGAFTVSFADAAHVVEVDYVGIVSANQEPKKMEKAGLHTTKSEFVDAPIIEEFPMALECKLLKINEDGNVIGQIVNVSADQRILDEDGKIDPGKLQAIAFDPVQNAYLVMGEKVGNAFSDGAERK